MKYAVEMGLGSMVYIAHFMEIGLGIQKVDKGESHRQNFPFFSK
jgi:hypothetical protein